LNATDHDGWTALHFAVSRDYQPIVAALLRLDADPTPVCCTGETPLCIAVAVGHREIIDLPPPTHPANAVSTPALEAVKRKRVCCERKVPRARSRSARACRLSHCAKVEQRGSTLVLFHSCAGASPRCLPLLYPLGRGRSPRHPPSQRPLAVPSPRRAPPPGSPRSLDQAGLPHTQRPPRVGAAAG